MNKEEHIFDNKIKETLFDHEEDVPSFAYDNIRYTVRKEPRSSKPYFIYTAASIALLFSFGLGYITSSLRNSEDNMVLAQQKNLIYKTSSKASNPNNDETHGIGKNEQLATNAGQQLRS